MRNFIDNVLAWLLAILGISNAFQSSHYAWAEQWDAAIYYTLRAAIFIAFCATIVILRSKK